MKSIVLKSFCVILLTLPLRFAVAEVEVHPFIADDFSVQVGVFRPSKDLKLRVDGSVTRVDQEFDWEAATDFGEDDEVFMLEAKWRFGQKWSFRAQYYESKESKRAVLEEQVLWRNSIILAGSNVSAGTEFSLLRAFFGRSFGNRAKVDTGIGLGLHWLEIGAFIQPDVNTIGDLSAASVSGPLPNIGAWYYYSPSPKWFLGGRLDWLEASIDKYDGGIVNVSAGVNYQVFKHVGVGVKYQLFRLNVDVDNDKWNGGVRLDYDGPFIYLSGNW
jgi:hypothetical protein